MPCPNLGAGRHYAGPVPTEVLSSSAAIANRFSATSLSDALMHHFYEELTPRLTWVDDSNNPWRTLIHPFSHRSSSVRTCLLYLASAHLLTRDGQHQQGELLEVTQHLRGQSLYNLNDGLKDQLQQSTCGKKGSRTVLLASVLLVCHAELLIPASTEWRVHLQGCRAIVDADHARTTNISRVDDFLVQEIADLHVFDGLSAFDGEQANAELLAARTTRPSAWTFTRLLHEVTGEERLLHRGGRVDERSVEQWMERFRNAYAAALRISSHDAAYAAVANAHFYAGIIYLHQALASGESREAHLADWKARLMSNIEATGGRYDHDLFWPLFIIGSEASPHEQADIVQHINDCIASSGFHCNRPALDFLETFWKHRSSSETWIEFARQHRAGRPTFLIF